MVIGLTERCYQHLEKIFGKNLFNIMARKELSEEEKKKKLTISINENMLEKLKILSKEQNISISKLIENILKNK